MMNEGICKALDELFLRSKSITDTTTPQISASKARRIHFMYITTARLPRERRTPIFACYLHVILVVMEL